MSALADLIREQDVYLELWDAKGPKYRVQLTLPPAKNGRMDVKVPLLVPDESFTVVHSYVTRRQGGKYVKLLEAGLVLASNHLLAGATLCIDKFTLHTPD